MKETPKVEIKDKILLTVEEAAAYSHIGENKIRELFRERDCNFVLKKGAFFLIKRKKFEEYILNKEVI